jgi:hypothetical protein
MHATDRDLEEVACVRANPGMDQDGEALRNLSQVGNAALSQKNVCNNEAEIAS